jgi:hypothetical protein
MKQDAVTWLDFRPDDLSQARDFIRSLQEEGVIDELGFLALQGRLSDLLHPATTTLMRSARYFYFVAGIYRQLEREGVRSSQVALLAQQRQDALATVLAIKERVGVIGRESGMTLRQFPSLIYWSALRKLGILNTNLSESGYQEQFDDIRFQRRGYQDDDKTPQGSAGLQYWSPTLPATKFIDAQGHVKPGTTFKFANAEALDLQKRFTSRFPHSLLSHMLSRRLIGIEWPWDCPKTSRDLDVWLSHAKNMSLFVRGATLQYYALLIEALDRSGSRQSKDIVIPVFEHWWAEAKRELKSWNTNEFVTVPNVASALRLGPKGDRWFIDRWLDRFLAAPSARALLADGQARDLIKEREVRVKPAKARLKYAKHLKQWKSDRVGDAVYQFNYRHNIGSRFVSEILDGMEHGQ